MTAAEKLRMEIAQEAPFSKDEFISKISRLIKAYGYASFICDKHIRETDGLLYRPNTCVDVEIPFYDDEKIRDMLNKASADIMKWCDKNMVKYNKELKESKSTKKHCEGLRKHIANLERRLLKHALANVILSIISVAAIIALFTLIQN